MSILTTPSTPTAEAIKELTRYFNEPYMPRKSDPLVLWKNVKTIYPSLYQLMLLRLCVPATSVPCERIFSKASYTVSDRRNRLTVKNTEN